MALFYGGMVPTWVGWMMVGLVVVAFLIDIFQGRKGRK